MGFSVSTPPHSHPLRHTKSLQQPYHRRLPKNLRLPEYIYQTTTGLLIFRMKVPRDCRSQVNRKELQYPCGDHDPSSKAGQFRNHPTAGQQRTCALNKLARTFTTQMETLKRYRTGGEQKVTVHHVTVNEGGQAIVGTVERSEDRGEG